MACCGTPSLPEGLAPATAASAPSETTTKKTSLSKSDTVKLVALTALLSWIAYAALIFPGERVVKWVELGTDGLGPDWIASDSQDVVGSHWKEALKWGYLDDISASVVSYLKTGKQADVLELAAGSGAAPTVWHEIFEAQHLCTRTILTDLQPKAHLWTRDFNSKPQAVVKVNNHNNKDDCGTFGYMASSVDATQASKKVREVLPNWGATSKSKKELRMIHLSLHHFEPELVKGMLKDAAEANSAVLIIDHDPNTGGLLYLPLLTLKQLVKVLPSLLMRTPIKAILAPTLPLFLVQMFHDASVSILRAYSTDQLQQFVLESTADAKASYDIQTIKSPGYGQWLGLPFPLNQLPGMQDQVMNFVLATPTKPGVSRQQFAPSTANHSDALVYGIHDMPPYAPPVSPGVQFVLLLAILFASYKYLVANKFRGSSYSGNDKDLIGKPAILAIGTANPPYRWTTENVNIALDWKRTRLALDDDFERFMRKVHKTSGVEQRWFGTKPPEMDIFDGNVPDSIYAQDGNPSVSERHSYWKEWAPKLAIQAAEQAVKNWGGPKHEISHVVFHSCTGFKAPGIELDIIDGLNLVGVRRRLGINYMGCFGGFTGMAVARAFCEADPTSIVLVVCAETCYSHIAFSENKSKTIGNCFFADGAAAAIIGPGRPGDWVISDQETKTLGTDTRELMTWQPSDHNYDMYLDKSIGVKFGMHLYWNLKSYLRGICKESVNEIEWCVHPGGKGILDFFCSEKLNLGITKDTLQRSYDVLSKHGNMSSGTIFFVLKELMKEAKENPASIKPTAICFGFGPGLTLEIAQLRRISCEGEGVAETQGAGVVNKTTEIHSETSSDTISEPDTEVSSPVTTPVKSTSA